MPTHRTVRKPTRWTPAEWRAIEEAAAARGIPPLRYVREAALAAKLPPRVRRRGAGALVREIKRVLNNLGQLVRLAEDENATLDAAWLRLAIASAEDAVRRATAGGNHDAHVDGVTAAGRFLNEVTHHAHTIEELPPKEDLDAALDRIHHALAGIGA